MVEKSPKEVEAINDYLTAFDKVVGAHLIAMGLPNCFNEVCKVEAERHGPTAAQCLFLAFLSIHLYASVRGKVENQSGEDTVISVINQALEAGHMFWGEALAEVLKHDVGDPIQQADTSKVN